MSKWDSQKYRKEKFSLNERHHYKFGEDEVIVEIDTVTRHIMWRIIVNGSYSKVGMCCRGSYGNDDEIIFHEGYASISGDSSNPFFAEINSQVDEFEPFKFSLTKPDSMIAESQSSLVKDKSKLIPIHERCVNGKDTGENVIGYVWQEADRTWKGEYLPTNKARWAEDAKEAESDILDSYYNDRRDKAEKEIQEGKEAVLIGGKFATGYASLVDGEWLAEDWFHSKIIGRFKSKEEAIKALEEVTKYLEDK